MNLAEIHGYVLGMLVIGTWVTVLFWSIGLRIVDPDEAPVFWRVIAVTQAVLALQVLYGLFLLGRWLVGFGGLPAADMFDSVFHMFYGGLFPLITLVVGHRFARAGRINPYSAFAVVALVNFGLTVRAYQVACVWPDAMCV